MSVNKAIRSINENKEKTVFDNSKPEVNSIGLPCMEGLKLVEISDIVCCEAKSTYTEFTFTDKKKLLVSKPLHVYEEILEAYRFYRIHNSHLINLNHIKEYIKGRGGNVIMTNNTIIKVAARKKDDFLKHILH